MFLLLLLLLLHHLPSIHSIACFTDIACIMLPDGNFACNNTALVDCIESQACFTYYSAPDLTHSPSSWTSSNWTRRLRGCASDDVVTSLFDTATGWSARCGFGGERLIEDMKTIMRDASNQTENAIIPILANNDSTIPSTFDNETMLFENNTLSTALLNMPDTNDTNPLNELNFTTSHENITISSTFLLENLLMNETIDNDSSTNISNVSDTINQSTSLPIVSSTRTVITQSSIQSTTTDPDATTEATESSTTSETDPGDAIGSVTESTRRIRRDAMVPAGYAGCLCYSNGCNGPNDKYLDEILQWLEKRAIEAQGKGDRVEVKTTDYEDTGAEPVSDNG
ncbi:hypothetical protein PRIPAC_84541 [Pristionchus pacificus]|uniref:Uncharacterized protein n=1 Tax=Pristionchus pacificus TaxID=54126 RepID=A0A2A6BP00_PRIPA|nr:hypothetical protein PRIPAC_84541 [Pristionchus pacificus]|eukprot:PDM67491.1 hypothetical protein PRIPAC_48908 [Pristionchus pacificus]